MAQVQMEDMNSQAQLSAAQQLANTGTGAQNLDISGIADAGDDDDDIPELEAVDDDGPIDESGVDPKDIDLLMAQVRYHVLFAHLLTHRCTGELHQSQGRASSEGEWRGPHQC
jgi:hypothetical protein